MSPGTQIFRNVGALTLARGVTAVVTLGTYAYLTRTLGPAAFGILSWGLAWLAYFSVGLDLGTGVYGVREVARDPSRVRLLAGQILSVRLMMLCVALVLFYGSLLLLDKPATLKTVVAVQGIALVGFALTMDWVFQGVERMGILAVRNVAATALTLAGILLFVHDPSDVIWAAAAMAGTSVIVALALGVPLVRTWGPLRLRGYRADWPHILRASLPIGASLFAMTIYGVTDQFLLGLLRTEQETGWYGAAYRVLTASLILGDILNQAFLPSLSNAAGDRSLMVRRGRAFATTLFSVGLPVTAAGALLAGDLITGFAGEAYTPATTPLVLLMAAASATYVSKAFGDALVAWNHERAYLAVVATGAGINVVLNLVLIPPYGGTGAAAATVCSAVFVLAGQAVLYRRVLGVLHLGALARALAATGLGVVAPLGVGSALGWPFLARVALCALAFPASAAACGLLRHLPFAWPSSKLRP